MSLTITVTLDDEAVAQFIDLYNQDAGVEITADMLNQNEELHNAIAEDMVSAWFDSFTGEDTVSAYDLYADFFDEEDVLTIPSDNDVHHRDDVDDNYT